ncbi:MAG: hypothetical protein H7Z16_13980 [Pyrinomonadaceae bacterium]|nr:hypothetical protein [Pyrinomonadaceae bacterium]
MGCRAQINIRGDCLANIPTIQRLIESLPKEVRTCSKCQEEAIVQVSEHLLHQDGGIPFGEAAIFGCDESLDKVIESVLRAQPALGDCFESKKS